MTWELWHDLGDSFVPFLYHQVYLWENSKCGDCELFFRSFERAKTIVDHRVRLWWKPLKNHWCQWSISEKNIQWWWFSGSKTIEKPLIAMVPSKKIITIPSLWKNDHRWSLQWICWSWWLKHWPLGNAQAQERFHLSLPPANPVLGQTFLQDSSSLTVLFGSVPFGSLTSQRCWPHEPKITHPRSYS